MLVHNYCVKRRIPHEDLAVNDGEVQNPAVRNDEQASGNAVSREIVNNWFS